MTLTETNDNPYLHLFSHHRMVADLLSGFVREAWVDRLDLASLERRIETRPEGRPVRGDGRTWRLRWQGSRSYVYLLLELPSEVDRLMALRMRVRAALLHEDLERRGELPRSRRLPWVLPLVVYRGEELWTAPRDVAELLDPLPRGMERYEQRGRYLLLDARREPIPESAGRDNLVAALFELERSASLEALEHNVARIAGLLPGAEGQELRRAFARLMGGMLWPGHPGDPMPGLLGLAETGPLLSETVALWARQWRESGREEGLREGRAGLLAHLLERRFGPLEAGDREVLEAAEPERLLAWGERLATAGSLAEVLGR